jgi:hypothetical protein
MADNVLSLYGLITIPSEFAILPGKLTLRSEKLKKLRWGDYFALSVQAKCNHKVLKSGRQR